MTRHRTLALMMAFILLVLVYVPALAQGGEEPCQWTGQKNADWGDKENWESCDEGVPTEEKDAIVGGGKRVPFLSSVGVARNIILQGRLNIGAAGRLDATSLTTEVGGGGHISNQGIVETPITVLGGLIVGGGGTFTRDVTVMPLSTLTVSTGGGGGGTIFNLDANLHNMGTVTTEGNNSVNFRGQRFTNDGTTTAIVRFPNVGEPQAIAGTGTWEAPGQIFLGGGANVALANPVTVTGQLRITNGSHFNIGSHTLTFEGAPFFYVDLDAAIGGNGTIRSQGDLTFSHDGVITPTLLFAAGNATGGGSGRFMGKLQIEPEATLTVAGASVINALNDVTNEGTIANSNGSTFVFQGGTLINDGTITSNVLFQRAGEQTLQGSGVFTATSQAFINRPTVLQLGSDHQMNQVTTRVGGGFDLAEHTLSIQGGNQGSNGPLVIAPGGFITTTNSTVVFNGMVTQPVTSYNITYHHLTANNAQRAETVQAEWPLIVRGVLRVQQSSLVINECDCHAIQIDEGASLLVNENEQVTVSGDWTNNGSFTGSDNTNVVFDGAGAQRIGGGNATAFRHLFIQNANGVELDMDATVVDRLVLDNDIRATGEQTLTLHTTALTVGAGDVWGKVRRPGPFTREIGYTFGNPNVRLIWTAAGTLPSAVVVELKKERPAEFASGVERTYRIMLEESGDVPAILRLPYRDEEVEGIAEERLQVWKQVLNGGSWQLQPRDSINTEANWLEETEVIPQGMWVLAPSDFIIYAPYINRQ